MNIKKGAFLLSGAEKAERNGYLWNFVALGINAAEAVIILMVATRTVSLEESGMLTMGFTVANLMCTVGKYGMRSFQVTDIQDEYSFKEYYISRILTFILMLLSLTAYMSYGRGIVGYSVKKCIIVICVCMIYAAEYFEDVYWGEYQKQGRIDVGAKMFSVRWTLVLITVCALLIISKSAVISVVAGTIVAWVSLFYVLYATKVMVSDKLSKLFADIKTTLAKVFRLLKQCSPLFLANFLNLYVVNASKYGIDACMSDEVQACYGFIAMPVFVVSVVNMVLYQPVLVNMSLEWSNGEKDRLKSRIVKQILIIVICTAICLVGAYIIGIPVLSWLYSTDLTDYKAGLLILLVGGLFQALSGFLLAVNTIMRKQLQSMLGHLVVAGIAFFATTPIIRSGGVLAAAIINSVWMMLVAMWYYFVMRRYWNRK